MLILVRRQRLTQSCADGAQRRCLPGSSAADEAGQVGGQIDPQSVEEATRKRCRKDPGIVGAKVDFEPATSLRVTLKCEAHSVKRELVEAQPRKGSCVLVYSDFLYRMRVRRHHARQGCRPDDANALFPGRSSDPVGVRFGEPTRTLGP